MDNGKILIIYFSSTGFTKRYAEKLKDELNADICTLDDIKNKNLDGYGTLIFGSCLRAGSIKDLKKFARAAKKFGGRKLAFCTGSMAYEDAIKEGVLEKNAVRARFPAADMFYCPGGLDFEHMPKLHKSMVEFYLNYLKKKKGKTLDEEKLAQLDTISFDAVDFKYLEPIIKAVKG